MRFEQNILAFLLFIVSTSSFGQVRTGVNRLKFSAGVSVDKNFVNIRSGEVGVNLFATRGRLVTDVINYFGVETSYRWITLESQNCNGIVVKGIYQYSKNPIGYNAQASILFARNSTFLLPEVGLNLYGILSLNYGYYLRLDTKAFEPSFHSLTLRLNVNQCYLAYMSMVGRSERKKVFK